MFARASFENASLVIRTEDFKEIWIYPNGLVFAPKFDVSRVKVIGLYEAAVKFLRFVLRGKVAVEEFDSWGETFSLEGGRIKVRGTLNHLEVWFHRVLFLFEFGKVVELELDRLVTFYEKSERAGDDVIADVLDGVVYKNASFVYRGGTIVLKSYDAELAKIENEKLKVGDFVLVFGKLFGLMDLFKWIGATFRVRRWKILTDENKVIFASKNYKIIYDVYRESGSANLSKFIYEVDGLLISVDLLGVVISYDGGGKRIYLRTFFKESERNSLENVLLTNKFWRHYLF